MLSTEWLQLFNLMHRLHRSAHRRARESAGPGEVEYTSTQIGALHAISTRPEWRMSDLQTAPRLGGNLTTMINRDRGRTGGTQPARIAAW